MDGTVHNNKMERMNGEIRDRERVMRTLEKGDSPILSGMQIFHNYVRPHMALKGKTPSEAAGNQGRRREQVVNSNSERKQTDAENGKCGALEAHAACQEVT